MQDPRLVFTVFIRLDQTMSSDDIHSMAILPRVNPNRGGLDYFLHLSSPPMSVEQIYQQNPVDRTHFSGTDLVGCVSSLNIPRASGGCPLQVLTLFGGVKYIAWRLRYPPFRGMPMGPQAFLRIPGASGLWPCARTHFIKALCHTHSVGGTADKNR